MRALLCPDKIDTEEWLDAHRTAHSLGLRSNITIMFGAVEQPVHWARHMVRTRALQAETGGFTEFVPLPFVHTSSPIYLAGVARPGPSLRDNLAVHAMARIMLHGLIDNIQCSWVKLGPEGTLVMPAQSWQLCDPAYLDLPDVPTPDAPGLPLVPPPGGGDRSRRRLRSDGCERAKQAAP